MLVDFSISEDYWETLEFNDDDIEFLNSHLLEIETPLSPEELIKILIPERIQLEKNNAEELKNSSERAYYPKEMYKVGDEIVFSALGGKSGKVTKIRPAKGIGKETFEVISVKFEDGGDKEFAMGLQDHFLNIPPNGEERDPLLDPKFIMATHGKDLTEKLKEHLADHEDFVYIAGRWFPRALIVDVNLGNLNLAEAVLDMAGGGPLPTSELLHHVGLPEGINPHLAEFSLDLALQENDVFDEVGSEGEVAWFLKRDEPKEVLKTPIYLEYDSIEYDREILTEEMLGLERYVDDEMSPNDESENDDPDVEIRLIFPHWRAGTLPLTPRISSLFPTAYEAPRIRFMLVDGDTGEKFPGWVVRLERYVYGLGEWYQSRGLLPGSYIHVRKGERPGEVVIRADSHRSNKEWVRTALVGADGGIVYALLKQSISATFDERMMIYLPADISALDAIWESGKRPPFEEIVVETLRELAKLNPQMHVHVTEIYSAINVRMRTPPGPIMSLLASRPWFTHVGDLHYRIEDNENE